MKKAGFKTFICSFSLSLFTILTVNGMYFHNKKSPRNIKIPSKNITLFLNDMRLAAHAQAVPVKKIVLSTLPAVPQKAATATEDEIPLTFGGGAVYAEDTVLQKEDDIVYTPQTAENTQDVEQTQNFAPPEQEIHNDKVINNFEEFIKKPPQIEPAVLASAEPPLKSEPAVKKEIKEKVPEQEQKAPQIPASAFDVAMTAPAPDNLPDVRNLIARTPQGKAPDNLFIPLEKSNKNVSGGTAVEISDSADTTGVALNAKNIPLKSMNTSKSAKKSSAEEPEQNWKAMEDIKPADDAWVVAKGTKHPKNSLVLNQASYQKDNQEINRLLSPAAKDGEQDKVRVAAETVKNILIPIPDDIMKEKNLTPQLVSSEKNKHLENEVSLKDADEDDEEFSESGTSRQSGKSSSLLSSISSLFSSGGNNTQNYEIGDPAEDQKSKNTLMSAFSRKKIKNAKPSKILPTEIRLSFQPNRAEISGQTLKWIYAFANKTIEDPSTGLEIRIDGTSSPQMQQRRLNLLHNILTSKGVDFGKINTVFTSREPNSFIIRTVRVNNEIGSMTANRRTSVNRQYMQW